MSIVAPHFDPTPEAADAVIDALGSPDETLRSIAESHGTTVEALTLWMAREDIAERLNNIESAVARRTRLIATNFLPSVVQTLNRIIDAYIYEESHVPLKPDSLMALEYRRRSREAGRRAASLLLRLARFHPSHQGARGGPSASSGSGAETFRNGNRAPRPPTPSLEDLLVELRAAAPELAALSGVAGCGGAAAPAPSPHQSHDRAPAFEPTTTPAALKELLSLLATYTPTPTSNDNDNRAIEKPPRLPRADDPGGTNPHDSVPPDHVAHGVEATANEHWP